MAFVGKVETIAAVGADGIGADAVWSRIETELVAWVTTVNGNNGTRPITLTVKPSDTTSNLYTGFIITWTANATAGSRVLKWAANNSATTIGIQTSATHTPGAANGGLGTMGTLIINTTGTMSGNFGYMNVVIADDTSGQEYFLATIQGGGAAGHQTYLHIYKSSEGDWVVDCAGSAVTSTACKVTGVGPGLASTVFEYSPTKQFISGTIVYTQISGPILHGILSSTEADPYTERVSLKPASAIASRWRHCSSSDITSGIQTTGTNDFVVVAPYIAFDFEGLV